MTTHTLKEHPDNESLVIDGAMQATVRYELEHAIKPGDTLVLVNAETGEEIARREVESVAETTIRDALTVIDRLGYDYHHDTPMPLLHAMRGHYPDGDIDLSSRVHVIMFAGPGEAEGSI